MFYLRFPKFRKTSDRKVLGRGEFSVPTSIKECLEREAIVHSVVCQSREWTVRYHGIFWKARSIQPDAIIMPGDIVLVAGRQELTLFISTFSHGCKKKVIQAAKNGQNRKHSLE
jgi:membrane protein implicated in regulation of membrane protease activity